MKLLPTLLSTLSILFLCYSLSAQYGPKTLVYKITDSEAAQIYHTQQLPEGYGIFHTLVDSFSIGYEKEPEVGHYLYVKADWEDLSIELESVTTISAVLLNNERDFTIQVIDSTGQAISDAEVKWGKRSLKYDPNRSGYYLKKWNKEGFVSIQARGESLFYKIERDRDGSIFLRKLGLFGRTKVGYVLYTPYRLGHRIYHFFKSGIRDGYWRFPFPLRFRWGRKDKDFKGYVALNQPKYRHGDTLKVKAYVTNHKGRPIDKPLVVSIQTYYKKRQIIYDTLLAPASPGVFIHEWILADSLRLDQTYEVRFEDARKWRSNYLKQRFRLGDYQLDQLTYTFESVGQSYSTGEKIILKVEGKDHNGFTAPDVEMKLTLGAGPIQKFYESEVRIPDTLWEYSQRLRARGPTQIIIPDSIIPPVAMTIYARAKFVNSNGEMVNKSILFRVDKEPERLDLKLEEGQVVVKAFKNGEEIKGQAVLQRKGSTEVEINAVSTIDLPYTEPLNPNYSSYHVQRGNYTKQLPLGSTKVFASGQRTKDSISIQIDNPDKIPVYYTIRTKGQLIDQGQTQLANFNWSRAASGNTAYFLNYQFIWAGRTYNREASFQPYKKLLNVQIEQPRAVIPGETVQLKVKVEDYKDQAAQGVNLVAGATNAQFGNTTSYKIPDIYYKPAKEPFQFNTFKKGKRHAKTWKKPFRKAWQKPLALDTSLFYKLRFPKDGAYMQYDKITRDSFYQNIAQFAPYVVKNGQAEPIHLIYCNRKLVYYAGVDNNPPYSFIGEEGYNTIVVRTKDFEYTIDSVLLKKGHKLEFSIDALHYPRSKYDLVISKLPKPDELTEIEKELLTKSIFIFKKHPEAENQFLWDDYGHIQFIPKPTSRYQKSNYKVGPFLSNTHVQYKYGKVWENRFLFEAGFSYEIAQNRERLYENDTFGKDRKKRLRGTFRERPGQLVYCPADMQTKAFKTWSFKSKAREKTRKAMGRYRYAYNQNNTSKFLVAVLKRDSSFWTYRPFKNITSLEEGNYEFYLFKADGTVHQRSIQIKNYSLLYQDLNDATFQEDTEGLWEQFFPEEKYESELKELGFKKEIRIPDPIPGYGRYVTGQITDAEGEPLIGVNILIKGTTSGTVTDIDGNYSLWVPYGPYEIKISYTGFNTMSLNARAMEANSNIVLDEGAALEEVVVVGYSNAASSLLRVRRGSTSDGISTLQARAAGLSVQRTGTDNRAKKRVALNLMNPEEEDEAVFQGNWQENAAGIRTIFRDYAYWVPNLITDQNGEAVVQVTFPEDITSWNSFVIGMDRKQRSGIGYARTKTYKPLLAQLSLPRFLVEGDETNIVGKSINYTTDTFQIETQFLQEEEPLQGNTSSIVDAIIEKQTITAPTNTDSLSLSYTLTMDQYGDGEKRQIPLFPKGIIETEGKFFLLQKDSAFNLQFDPEKGSVTLYAEGNAMDLLLRQLKYLKDYPFGCNEQTASRLMALLMEKAIRSHLKQDFDGEKAILKAINKLEERQNAKGYWGWWEASQANYWMTNYVLKALIQAQKAGYRVKTVENGLRFLTASLKELEGKELLNTLELLSSVNQQADYQAYLQVFDTMPLPLGDQLRIIKIRQADSLEYSLDSLYHHRKETLFKTHYWNGKRGGFYHSTIQNTLLAYKILKKEGKESELESIRTYLLANGENGLGGIQAIGLRTTFEIAQILATILPDLLKSTQSAKALETSISVNNAEPVQEFPLKMRLEPNQPLRLDKKGLSPVFLTAYQQFQNKNPESRADIFEIQSQFFQGQNLVSQIQQGQSLLLKVNVDVKSTSSYVLIEVPIPAGCSYASKPQRVGIHESYREYFKDRVAIFCERLETGRYTFTIDLEPRFSGQYTLNPVKVEQMYFPTFYGRNEMGQLTISKEQ